MTPLVTIMTPYREHFPQSHTRAIISPPHGAAHTGYVTDTGAAIRAAPFTDFTRRLSGRGHSFKTPATRHHIDAMYVPIVTVLPEDTCTTLPHKHYYYVSPHPLRIVCPSSQKCHTMSQ